MLLRRGPLERLRRLWSLDLVLTVQAAVLIPGVDVSVRAGRLRRVRWGLDAWAGTKPWRPTRSQDEVRRAVDAVALRYRVQRSCLARALVLQTLLRRHGHAATIQYGVRRSGSTLRAHAWVEVCGHAVGPGAGGHVRLAPRESR